MFSPYEIPRTTYIKDNDIYLIHYRNIYNELNITRDGLSSEDCLVSKAELDNLLKNTIILNLKTYERIFILGHKGMLGNAVYKFFSARNKYTLLTTEKRWGNEAFNKELSGTDAEIIINCIGIIPQKNLRLNYI